MGPPSNRKLTKSPWKSGQCRICWDWLVPPIQSDSQNTALSFAMGSLHRIEQEGSTTFCEIDSTLISMSILSTMQSRRGPVLASLRMSWCHMRPTHGGGRLRGCHFPCRILQAARSLQVSKIATMGGRAGWQAWGTRSYLDDMTCILILYCWRCSKISRW